MEYSLDGHNASLSAIRTVRVLRPLRAINRVPSKCLSCWKILIKWCIYWFKSTGSPWLSCWRSHDIYGSENTASNLYISRRIFFSAMNFLDSNKLAIIFQKPASTTWGCYDLVFPAGWSLAADATCLSKTLLCVISSVMKGENSCLIYDMWSRDHLRQSRD